MTELERRALMGDKQAQQECTGKGIVLGCPCCGSKKVKVMSAGEDCFVTCLSCRCASAVVSTEEIAFKIWNARPAPPIGKCGNCTNACDVGDNLLRCDIFDRDMMPDDFCSQFKPKEREGNAVR